MNKTKQLRKGDKFTWREGASVKVAEYWGIDVNGVLEVLGRETFRNGEHEVKTNYGTIPSVLVYFDMTKLPNQ